MSVVPRPPRTFGLSIAILTSAVLFGVLPLMLVGLFLTVQMRFGDVYSEAGGQPLAVGADIIGIPTERIILQVILAAGFLVIAGIAWRGRPAVIRWVLVAAVLGLTALELVLAIIPSSPAPLSEVGYSSLDSIAATLMRWQVAVKLLVSLYIVWYFNRRPARDFFRGMAAPTGPDESQT